MINYNKKQNIQNAQKHEDLMNKLFKPQIEDSLKNTQVVTEKDIKDFKTTPVNSEVLVWNTDTYSATVKARKMSHHAKIAVLNFADYKDAGGGYMKGMMAQEEAICGQSDLYPVISQYGDYYDFNAKHMNNGLYMDRALYTPDILWGLSTRPMAKSDVITCAAPRKSRGKYIKNVQAQKKYYHDANNAMLKRMKFVKKLAEKQGADVLILGAWGAGAFGFDAKEVAQMWQKAFADGTSIKQVIYAIINDKRSNNAFKAFEDVFNK